MTDVVLWLLADLDDLRQEREALRYAEGNGLSIVALMHDPAAVLAAVHDGVGSGVLVAVEPLYGAAELLAGVRLYVARRLARRDVEAELVRRALANTKGAVALVAEVLGVPPADVARLAGAQQRCGLVDHRYETKLPGSYLPRSAATAQVEGVSYPRLTASYRA